MLGRKKALPAQLPGGVQRRPVKAGGDLLHRRGEGPLVVGDGGGEHRLGPQHAPDHGQTVTKESGGGAGAAHGEGLVRQLLGVSGAPQLGGGVGAQVLAVGGDSDGVGVGEVVDLGGEDPLGRLPVQASQVHLSHEDPGEDPLISAGVQAQPQGRAQQQGGENGCDDPHQGKPPPRLPAGLRLDDALAFHSSLLSFLSYSVSKRRRRPAAENPGPPAFPVYHSGGKKALQFCNKAAEIFRLYR